MARKSSPSSAEGSAHSPAPWRMKERMTMRHFHTSNTMSVIPPMPCTHNTHAPSGLPVR